MSQLIQDARYAWRQILRNPGFAVTAVVTLALGIGINAAMFSVIDAVLLRPLPFAHPKQIVLLGETNKNDRGPFINSLPNARDWQAQSHSFQAIVYSRIRFHSIEINNQTDFLPEHAVSGNFFAMLETPPLLGRTLSASDANSASGRAVVLNYEAWSKYFNKDRNAIGRSIKLGADSYTVVGVMPQHFQFPMSGEGAQVWTLLVPTPQDEARDSESFEVAGRLKPGVSIDQARAELSTIQANLAREHKLTNDRVSVEGVRESLTRNYHSALLALQAAVLLIWLIACANVASLMLTRAAGRRREFAIRTALGAGKRRVMEQVFAESLLISLLSAAVGIALAFACLRVLNVFIKQQLPLSENIGMNLAVLGALALFSILSAMVFGTAPALLAVRSSEAESLRDGAQQTGVSRRQRLLLSSLVSGQIALSLILLIAAGLMLRSLYAVQQVPLGFSPSGVISGTLFLESGKYQNKDVAHTLYAPLLDRLQHLPGIDSASITTAVPLTPNFTSHGTFEIVGQPKDPSNPPSSDVHIISPDYYRTLGIPLLRGRAFQDGDTASAPMGAVINRAFMQKYFPGKDPIGQQLKISDKGPHPVATIIGVVGDTEQQRRTVNAGPELDISYLQISPQDDLAVIFTMFSQFALHTVSDPSPLIPSVEKVIRDVDPELTALDIHTMQTVVDDSVGTQALAARLLWIFAAVALFICAAGIYGSLAYNVGQRRRDIGLRMAFGATRGDVLWLILRHSAIMFFCGAAIGAIAALAAGRVLASFLFGVSAHDPATLAAVCALLAAVVAIASYIPARRASRIDPIKTLRYE